MDNPLQAFEPPMFAGDSHPSYGSKLVFEWDEFSHAILSRFGSSTPNTIAASSPPKSGCPSSSTFPVTSENEPLQVGEMLKNGKCNNDSGLEACLSSSCSAVAFQESGKYHHCFKEAFKVMNSAYVVDGKSPAERVPTSGVTIEYHISSSLFIWIYRLLTSNYYYCELFRKWREMRPHFRESYIAGLRKDMTTDDNFTTTIDKASINLVHGAGNSARATLIEEIFLGSHMGNNKSQNQVHWTRKKIHFPHYKGLLQPSSITELKAYTYFHLSDCTLLVSELVIEVGGKIVLTFRMGCDLLYIRCSMKVCFNCYVNSFGRGNYFDFKEPYKDSQELLNASLS
ncbi:hypothetical protein LINPERPRIM_LOCUS38170 [Linum perenne]